MRSISIKSLIDFMKLLFLAMSCSSYTTQHFCALTNRSDVYGVWISDTGSLKLSGHYLNDRLHSVSPAFECYYVEKELI